MTNLFKKQSAKFVQNPSSFTKVMAKHILVCFFMPHSVVKLLRLFCFYHYMVNKDYQKPKEQNGFLRRGRSCKLRRGPGGVSPPRVSKHCLR